MESDLLSCSPSLLDIISFVHPKDIPNCQLVSKMLDKMITRNRKLLRKPSAAMRFDANLFVNHMGTFCYFDVVVSIEDEKEKEVFRILKNHTVIHAWFHKRCITECYKENGIELVEREYDNEIRRVFTTASFDRGLRLALRYFFNRYQFSCIQFGSNRAIASPLDSINWCPIVLEEFRRCRTVYNHLQLFTWHEPILHSFYTFGRARALWFVVLEDLGQILSKIPRWEQKLDIMVGPDVFKDFGTIVDFLKNWESGEISRINTVFLCPIEKTDARRFNLTSANVIRMLSCFQCVTVTPPSQDGKLAFYVQVLIRRRIDGRILVILHHEHDQSLLIKDYEGLRKRIK